jgi:hypothetical protein
LFFTCYSVSTIVSLFLAQEVTKLVFVVTIRRYVYIGILLSVGWYLQGGQLVGAAGYEVEIFATVPGCGDEVIQSAEQCDGTNLGGASCSSVGFSKGELSCSSVCTLVTAACTLSSVSGGGSQTTFIPKADPVGDEPVIPATNLVVSGYFIPYGRVSLLKDGVLSGTTIADDLGFFQQTISGLGVGEYGIQILGALSQGVTVYGEVFRVRIAKESTTWISNIYLPPTFVLRDEGSFIDIVGVTAPAVTITPVVNGVLESALSVLAGDQGEFIIRIPRPDTGVTIEVSLMLESRRGDVVMTRPERIIVHASNSAANSSWCEGGVNAEDLCRVNLVDFLTARWLLLYEPSDRRFDYDGNGVVDIVDFSIMAYIWTG